jgi:hypothetical protein
MVKLIESVACSLCLLLALLPQGWAALLVELFTSRAAVGNTSNMAGLLQLLLNLATHSGEAQAAAAAAVRAVCSAAFKASWPELHHFAPLLMQVCCTRRVSLCCVCTAVEEW